MSETDLEQPTTAFPLDRLVRCEDGANPRRTVDGKEFRLPTMDEFLPNLPWNRVEDGEPEGSPIYAVIGHEGAFMTATRHPSGNWLMNGIPIAGVTHWKEIPNDVITGHREW